MKTTLLTDLTVADICEGFVYNELEGKGLFGWGGRLYETYHKNAYNPKKVWERVEALYGDDTVESMDRKGIFE